MGGYSGELDLIVYQAGSVDILRISSAQDPTIGAHIQGSYVPWVGDLDGELVMLGGQYKKSFFAQVSQQGFDVPLEPLEIGIAKISGRVKLAGDTLTLTVDGKVGVPVAYMGVSLTPVCSYREITSIDLGDQSLSKSYTASASIFGITVSVGPITIAADPSTVESIASRVYAALISGIQDAIETYLLGWAGELADMGTAVAGYVADFGGQIVDAFSDLFDGGGSNGPPPPFLINASANAASLDTLMVQWGQALSTSDGDQSFALPQAFGGDAKAVLLNMARPNIKSSLSVGARATTTFTINRDNAIDYHLPFHWLAIGPAPGHSVADSGHVDLGQVRIQWGGGTSTSDGDQSFNLPTGFGTGPVAVVVNTDEAGIRSALAITSVNAAAGRFELNRDNDVDGSVDFRFLAIGPAPGQSLDQGILRHEGLILQWGQGTSTSDGEQLFEFPTSFGSMNFAVVTSFLQANVKSSLSLSRAINEAGFVANRDGAIDGAVPFNWIAVGW
ncbi:gp53-like domain-containing protein [Enhygromyxa salina]|uniref:Putative tail fiber protein gp53-like C-terminal domain-containing protein n=1 Tax=Enhygromyxa salina TaxID=215803 RepID=A0A2S9XN67_9BACT|nr:hypothetical protein [Enhygromyxa salina]PRP94314.1 hypothetical protein ENSA7_78510 [Enhygromyxa salina]